MEKLLDSFWKIVSKWVIIQQLVMMNNAENGEIENLVKKRNSDLLNIRAKMLR